jgi:glycolate oxidase FAD binding subunit
VSLVTDSAVSRLESVLGANAIFTAKAANRELYAIDGVAPTALAKPASAEQAAEIIRFAAKEKLAVVPVGARTKLFLAAAPPRYDVALDLTALDEVAHYDPADLTVSIGAGMPLSRLNAMLQQQNQFLPLQVPCYSRSTIAGTVASGLDSPLRNAYGTARDFLLGAEFIDGRGAQIKTGGRVVKNVTGYDLHKLLVGSLGTLAVITRLNFRTFPIPASTRGFLASFPNHEAALGARQKIIHSPLTPLTLDVFNTQTSRVLADATHPDAKTPSPLDLDHWQLFAEFAGNDDLLARYKRDLTEFAEQSQSTQIQILEDAQSLAAVSARLRESIALFRESSPNAIIVKLSAPPTRHAQVITILESVAGAARIPLAIVARAAGSMYLAVAPPVESSTPESIQAFANFFAHEIHALARSSDGRPQLISAPSQVKSQFQVLFASANSSDRALLQKIKSAFDPQSTFASLTALSTPPPFETSPHLRPLPEPAAQITRPPTPPSPPPSRPS